MTKEEVLQKVNDYCTEKQYTNATLTDGFKDKFAEHFVKGNPEGDINDESVLNSMKFALNTAFSSASELATVKVNEFTSKENDYKNQIAELNKKIANPQHQQQQQQQFELPEDVKNQLAELQQFKNEQSKQNKRKAVLALAKKSVREDYHSSFTEYAEDFDVDLTKDDKEQADALVAKYQKVMRPTIGDIKPLAPRQTQKRDEEILDSIKEVKVC